MFAPLDERCVGNLVTLWRCLSRRKLARSSSVIISPLIFIYINFIRMLTQESIMHMRKHMYVYLAADCLGHLILNISPSAPELQYCTPCVLAYLVYVCRASRSNPKLPRVYVWSSSVIFSPTISSLHILWHHRQ